MQCQLVSQQRLKWTEIESQTCRMQSARNPTESVRWKDTNLLWGCGAESIGVVHEFKAVSNCRLSAVGKEHFLGQAQNVLKIQVE